VRAQAAAPTPAGLLRTVDRAAQVLLGFTTSRRDWGVTEVAIEFGWDKSVAQRILATLAYRRLLIKDPGTHRYGIGPAAVLLHRLWERSGSLQLLAGDLMEELTSLTGLTSVLAVPDIAHVRCVHAVEGRTGRIRYYPLLGELYPAHAGATSKSYFAFLDAAHRKKLLDGRPMAKFTDHTVTNGTELERQLTAIKSQGYAYTVGEYDAGIATLGVPIMLRHEPIASLSLGGPRAYVPDSPHLLRPLRECRDAFERRVAIPQATTVPS